MTRDIDFVIDVTPEDVPKLVAGMEGEYYVPREIVKKAAKDRTQFNLIHLESVIKVDCFVRKDTEFGKLEFLRRRPIVREDLETVVVSKEDLILSKLAWARPSHSEFQLRDVRSLLETAYDKKYLDVWADKLGLRDLLEECLHG